MKINGYVRIAAGILAVIWMFRIFSFSDAPASVSMQTSRSVSYDIVSAVNEMFDLGMDDDRVLGLSRSIEKTVRKLAHMCEFAVLGALVGCACDAWRYSDRSDGEARRSWRNCNGEGGESRRPWKDYIRASIAFVICLIYGATDEFHQTFVDGRSGEVRDVLVDALGALIAIILIWFIIRRISSHIAKSGQEKEA